MIGYYELVKVFSPFNVFEDWYITKNDFDYNFLLRLISVL